MNFSRKRNLEPNNNLETNIISNDDNINSNSNSIKFDGPNRQIYKTNEARMALQDKQIEALGQTVSNIKEISLKIGEAIDRQEELIDDISHDVEKTTGQMKTTSKKVKEVHNQTKSSCIIT